MPRLAPARFVFLFAGVLALAACQSSQERAEGYYQSAVELLAQGDVERGLVELRNVFDLDGSHREARLLYADTLVAQGRDRDAYGQYLRLSEQYPEDLGARLALARIAATQQDWDEVRRHGEVARELDPENPAVRVVGINIDYADALDAEDAEARREVVRRAEALSEEIPENLQLHRVIVDGALREGDPEAALAEIEETLQIAPEERSLYDTRVSLLAELGLVGRLETALRDMIERFPGDETIVANLVRFYVSRDSLDEAETFLRSRAESAPAGRGTENEIDLVQFLLELRSPEAALEELDRAIAQSDDDALFRSMRARIRFDMGETAEAIAEMQEVLESAGEGLDGNDDRVILARMLDATGNRVGAQRLIAEVLDTDRTQVDALKLQAGWRIAADEADGAISLLRTALDEAPQDVEALTLMAEAHLRNGNRDLARDMLSLAVQASNSAAAETRRYVALLLEDGRLQLAEEVLTNALRVAPGNTQLLVDLGGIYLRSEDLTRTRQIEDRLRALATPAALRAADGMQAARLSSEGRTEEAIIFLQDLAAENSGDIAARIAVVQARLTNGDPGGALAYAEEALAEAPESVPLNMIHATTLSAVGLQDRAEASFRKVLELDDQVEQAWIGLLRALYAQGEIEAARAALDEGLAVMPQALNLLWAQASFLERSGDFEGALLIYESLYTRAPDAPVIVNNYASLLSTLRSDPESLEKAYMVARRLRGTDQAPFRDTFGWIAHLRGDQQVALEHLEPAAEELADDPLVQYHLAETYLALGREADALARFRQAVELAGTTDTRPQFDQARVRIETLTAGSAAPDGGAAPAGGDAAEETVRQ